MRDLTAYRPVSIKRPVWNFLKRSLLNVRYDQKNEGLNILLTQSYNRVVRVGTYDFMIKLLGSQSNEFEN